MSEAAMDDEEYTRLCAEALAKSASRAGPRSLPKQPEPREREDLEPTVADMARRRKRVGALELPRSRNAGDLTEAARRMATSEAFGTFAKVREEEALDAVRKSSTVRTREVKVESPYGRDTNGFDTVERVIDTIDLMLRARQIDANQEAAARMIADAWALAPGAIRCALDVGEGGQGPGSRSPSEGQIWAGGILNDVRRELGRLDGLVVIRICGIGMSVEQTARVVFAVPDNARVKQHQTHHVGVRLRMALTVMANIWGIGARKPKIGVLKGAGIGALSERERAAKDVERIVAPKMRRRKLRRAVHHP